MSMDKKLDQIQEDVTEIKVTMARNTASLELHMRRSDLLEQKIEPLEKHVNMVNGALKLLSLLGIITAIVAAIYGMIK